MSNLESVVGAMTVGELCLRAHRQVAEFVEAVFGGHAPTSPRQVGAADGKVARGGLVLDHVLAALASAGAGAKLEDVRSKTGGTVPQVRAALQKLAASKRVRITGQRRGTRYAAV